MSSFRITIHELKPRAADAAPTVPATGTEEVKVFEQVVENLSVQAIIRQINATPRRRKAKS